MGGYVGGWVGFGAGLGSRTAEGVAFPTAELFLVYGLEALVVPCWGFSTRFELVVIPLLESAPTIALCERLALHRSSSILACRAK